MRKNAGAIISYAVTLLSAVFPGLLPSPMARLAFALLAIVAISFYFVGQETGRRGVRYISYLVNAGLILTLVVCVAAPGFPSEALERIRGTAQDGAEEMPTPEELYWQNRSGSEASLAALWSDIDGASKTAEELSEMMQSQALLSTASDPDEVQAVLDKMEQDKEVIEQSFPGITTDSGTVMLFYKMRLYERIWHYSSIVKAFQIYGIDCQALGIDEYTLLIWDIENLYNIYSMKKELEKDLKDDTFYAEKKLYFDDHKMENMNEYSDLSDYREWNFSYENKTARELERILADHIMNYYKRFVLNFSRPAA